MEEIYFSTPVNFVEEDKPLIDCLRVMKNLNIGSLIVLSSGAKARPLGIFTERDLLKYAPLLIEKDGWSRSIRYFMTSPLITISPTDINFAGENFLKHKIRHLPMVIEIEGRDTVVGMISMRDVFQNLVEDKRESESISQKIPLIRDEENSFNIVVSSMDPGIGSFFSSLLTQRANLNLKLVSPDKIFHENEGVKMIEKFDLALIDFDNIPAKNWANFLRNLATSNNHPHTVLIYDQKKHLLSENEAIQKFGDLGKISAFPKPISVGKLLNKINILMQKKRIS